MKNLVAIELKKINLKNQFLVLLLCNLLILFLSVTLKILVPNQIEMVSQNGAALPAVQLETMTIIDTLIKAVFIVWEAVLLAEMIVAEFKTKTALMFYTYPVKITKIILAKLLIILSMMFGYMLLSEVFQNSAFYVLGLFVPSMGYQMNVSMLPAIFVTTIAGLLLGLISLCVGIMYRSTVGTVVTSILILCVVTSAAAGPGGMISKVSVALVLGGGGLISGGYALKKIAKEELV
ncbi:hypothetical protein QUF99_07515 [Bacillus sp. DX4.1]|uniref:hypothetical protein n=1 Tax=Bacillus sp. DX4.1 TaxID=3055867 RepID=UPI0025A16C5B|nr:hypothetical protein [Bacillus sp. DX4.1]MDM5187177.1 hypothetical protein [Bacillus sp. DX4.1]